MKVYVVLTSNIDEEPCELEGVYSTHAKAAAKLREIKENWQEYAGDDIVTEESDKDYYALWTSEEFMEAKIIEQEVE